MTRARPTPAATAAALLIASLACRTAAAQADAPESAIGLQERLDRLVERLEEQRQMMHIPGMAIAVVMHDRVVLSRGFGLADLEAKTPVTDETIFAAGSTTKAFTAALVAMLADDGVLSLDDPVRTHLPGYHLSDPAVSEQVLMRDLLCHRIGLAAMTFVWYGNGVPRSEILEVSYRAKLLHPFRERFNYSNESYLAAGEAAGRAAGSDWDALMARRIFEPLGMTSTNTSVARALEDPRTAKGYEWDKKKETWEHMPMRPVDNIAPAGAINSNVRDLARWVRLQLGRGAMEGERLLSPELHEETWREHVKVGGGVGYGLGWFLRDWNGKRVIEHAGGIDGFTAEIAMVPDEGLGFVLLMNLFISPLQDASRQIVFDTLLGDPGGAEGPAAAPAALDHEPYVGTYLGDFAHFSNARFEVLVRNGNLAVDVPGQMVFELRPPDEEGLRAFSLTDQIKVRFNASEPGGVHSMTIFQSGYAFELPREGRELPLDTDLELARRYLGRYRSERLGADLEVLIRSNRLAVDVPGQMVCDLYPPDQEGRWLFRVRDSVSVSFRENDAGEVTSMVMVEDGQTSELPRVAGSEAALPSAPEILERIAAATGSARLKGISSFRAVGQAHLVHQGLAGSVTTLVDRDLRMAQVIDFGKFGKITTILGEDRGWVDLPMASWVEFDGEALEEARRDHPVASCGDWRETFAEVRLEGEKDFDGKTAWALRLLPARGPAVTVFVDPATALPVGRKAMSRTLLDTRIPTTERYGDYRDVAGVMLPFRVEVANEVTGSLVIQYEHIETGVETPDGAFVPP